MGFMDKDFLLKSDSAKMLYFDYAADMPIIDYHCHLDAAEILENKRFKDLSEAWLGGDHYKWRLMRVNGIAERYITGDAPGFEKFMAFAEVLPRAAGNPVYHWAHLELQRFFGCDTPLNPDTAKEIWDFCNNILRTDESLRVHGIIDRMNIEVIVTTDDPADSLDSHKKIAADGIVPAKILPGWRPGVILEANRDDFIEYLDKLSDVSGIKIDDFNSLKSALCNRMEFFNAAGCRTADHGICQLVYAPAVDERIDSILKKRLRNETLTTIETDTFRYTLMRYLTKEYARYGWVMELHLGVMRSINTKMYDLIGPDTGFESIDPSCDLSGIAEFMDELNSADCLPKTILFSLNPAFDHIVNTLAGCFPQEGIKSKVQQGSAWWFNDTLAGMEQQIVTFAEGGVLANFVGMLTDSRSFLSYTRHEYFRRILCNIIGEWIDSGKYPADKKYLEILVKDICYNNVKSFFNF